MRSFDEPRDSGWADFWDKQWGAGRFAEEDECPLRALAEPARLDSSSGSVRGLSERRTGALEGLSNPSAEPADCGSRVNARPGATSSPVPGPDLGDAA